MFQKMFGTSWLSRLIYLWAVVATSFVYLPIFAQDPTSNSDPIIGIWNLEGEFVTFHANGTWTIPSEPDPGMVEFCATLGNKEIAEQCTGRWTKTKEGDYLIKDPHLHNVEAPGSGCACTYTEGMPSKINDNKLMINTGEQEGLLVLTRSVTQEPGGNSQDETCERSGCNADERDVRGCCPEKMPAPKGDKK